MHKYEGVVSYWTAAEFRDMHQAYIATANIFFDGNIRKTKRVIRLVVGNPLAHWKKYHGQGVDLQ